MLHKICHSTSQKLLEYNAQIRRNEIKLWRHVITQALEDCQSSAKRSEIKLAKLDAIRWFDLSNSDFITVCILAEVDPQKVINLFIFIIKPNSNGKKTRQSLSKIKAMYEYLKIKNTISKIQPLKKRSQYAHNINRKEA